MSPDSIVPGAGALALAPHDAVARRAWAQRGGDESEQDGATARSGAVAAPAGQDAAPPERPPTAPANPQALNRYAYALNNPLQYVDPTGHWVITITLPSLRLGAGVGGSLNYGIAIDGYGQIHTFSGSSHGVTVGWMASLSAGMMVYPQLERVDAIGGDGVQIGTSGGYLGRLGFDVANPNDPNWGIGLSLGVSPPVAMGEYHIEVTHTLVDPGSEYPRPGQRDPCVDRPGYCGDTGVPLSPRIAIHPARTPTPLPP